MSGASGLIGSALVAHLDRGAHDVVRLVRLDPTEANEVRWDPGGGALDAGVLSGADAVVNLNGVSIGERRWSDDQKRRILDSRVSATELIASRIAELAGAKPVFVSASAVGYYGDCGDEILTEDVPPADDFLATVCRKWEAATRAAADSGARTVCLRTGVVLSSAGGLLERLSLPFKLGLGGRLGSGRQWMSWIGIADLVAVVEHVIADDSVSGPVNAVVPEPVTNSEFTVALGKALHRPTLLPTPMPVLRAVYGRELVQALMLASQRAVPARLEAGGYRFRAPEIGAALAAALRS